MAFTIETGLQVWTIALSVSSIALSTIAVILRLVAKYMRKRIDASDYCIIAALVLYPHPSSSYCIQMHHIDHADTGSILQRKVTDLI